MMRILLTGLGAGAAAALLFASAMSRILLSLFLFYLAPLPIMIVALGWSHLAGLVGAVAAAAGLGAVFGLPFGAAFLVLVGAPAWWLGYLALLGRPLTDGGGPEQMEWYPPGRLLLWASVFGAAVTAGMMLLIWGDETAMRNSIKAAVDLIRSGSDAAGGPPLPPELSGVDTDLLVDVMVRMLPPMAAVIASLTQTVNLWLAGQIVRLSGRLRRPWPDLTALSLPPLAAVLYGASLAGAFLPGLPGIVAGLFAATLTTAFAMVGLAVLHTVTRGMRGRTAVLTGAYACLFLLVWPLMLATVTGVAETLVDLRTRFSRPGPPAPGAKDGR